jgi:hypothetical protein
VCVDHTLPYSQHHTITPSRHQTAQEIASIAECRTCLGIGANDEMTPERIGVYRRCCGNFCKYIVPLLFTLFTLFTLMFTGTAALAVDGRYT